MLLIRFTISGEEKEVEKVKDQKEEVEKVKDQKEEVEKVKDQKKVEKVKDQKEVEKVKDQKEEVEKVKDQKEEVEKGTGMSPADVGGVVRHRDEASEQRTVYVMNDRQCASVSDRPVIKSPGCIPN
ncbi:hypothetical protein DPEC_G00207630 [Dallia pectoralis]|uniref:Uncharacterized protein n=1 Tax=Dallia pectoralis TaxID=75939 RepID=A0ACC2G4X2_DALPE|nr:hypothetical protein DPEC_G00207630 [Dallia pectoralis]